VPVFLEKFLLPLFVTVLVAVAVTNPMKFDATQRITGVLALSFAAYFISHTLHIAKNQPPAVPANLQGPTPQLSPVTQAPTKPKTPRTKKLPSVPTNDSTVLPVIQSISIEARLTCTLKDGEELPPSEVPFLPVSDANAYFQGPAGDIPIAFVSPVRFRRQGTNEIVIINEFASVSPALMQRPVKSLATFQNLKVPTITIVWGKSMDKMRLFEVSLRVNGNDIWYYPYTLDAPFQDGPVFTIPLAGLQAKLQ
jgi:hypothetical protein